jgi:hypothetical protein
VYIYVAASLVGMSEKYLCLSLFHSQTRMQVIYASFLNFQLVDVYFPFFVSFGTSHEKGLQHYIIFVKSIWLSILERERD